MMGVPRLCSRRPTFSYPQVACAKIFEVTIVTKGTPGPKDICRGPRYIRGGQLAAFVDQRQGGVVYEVD